MNGRSWVRSRFFKIVHAIVHDRWTAFRTAVHMNAVLHTSVSMSLEARFCYLIMPYEARICYLWQSCHLRQEFVILVLMELSRTPEELFCHNAYERELRSFESFTKFLNGVHGFVHGVKMNAVHAIVHDRWTAFRTAVHMKAVLHTSAEWTTKLCWWDFKLKH